ncbi:S9 family peptidase [Sphingomonas morindae]|uniref:S9 family peptidase n=1 Tax=Sphingomonas morindae TaxID=1541170 RepID=A0ABY4X821_9SPHN|nr:DPP IV N-terminal domain-containing protein [Sphingomonas morindae]USI73072.1 S9 family peptidase [Sphingomonas morindae]
MSLLLLAAMPLLATLPAAALPPAAMPAPQVPQVPLTIERIFASPALSGPSPRKLALSPDGRYATLLKPRADDRERFDLWAVDTRTGAERMLVDSKAVGSGAALSEAEKMRRERARIGGSSGIVDYDWAPDASALLVPLDGDLYLAGLDGKVRRLTNSPATEIDAHISEDGRFVSFVRDQNLYAINLASGAEQALTHEGGGTVTCGTAEFVAQEEMDRFTGTWWAPSGAHVAVECYDEAAVKTVTRAAIGAEGTRTFEQRYPAAGTPNVAVSLWVMAPDGGGRVKVDLGADPDIYLARVDWSKDGRTLYVQRQSRDQKRLDMLAIDPATGKGRILFTETSKTWVALHDDFRPLADGSLIWRSARDGYAHLYRFAKGRWTQLTRGPWVVTGLVGLDETRHRLIFTGTKDDVLEGQVYALDYLAPGEPKRLTERGYSNSAEMDRAGTHLLVTRSSPTQPPQLYLADAEGQRIAWIEENRIDAHHPYAPFVAAHRPVSYGTLSAADGSLLHYEMITPALEPGKRYPVFFEHYGGPTAQQVKRAWMSPMAQYWVSKGWIYFQLDNRGSANRGRAFEDQIYHAMGTVEVADQAEGARWLAQQPFVDARRIATYGWSYGGYMTLKMLEKDKQGLYAAGIAGAPVTRWELYDTHYTERYLGNPATDAAPYAAGGAVTDAPQIRAPMLLIHGLSDDNVVFENSAALINRLQETDTPFEMMLYTGQTHRIAGPGRQAHVQHTIERFLDTHVRDRR